MPVAAIPLGLKALSSLAGGIAGYQRGGLKGALIGGGLGAVAPGAVRMAGTALGGTALGGKALAGIGSALSQWSSGVSMLARRILSPVVVVQLSPS